MADSPRIEELKRRVQMDPASIAFAALAEEYRRAGRYEEAIDVCRTGLQRHASYISAHVTLGRALMEVGRYDEARQELEYVLSVAPENLAAIRGLAEIHHRQGQSSEHTDLTASEMADMLAPRQSVPVRVEKAEGSQTTEKAETTDKAVKTEETEASGKAEASGRIQVVPIESVETADARRPVEATPMADAETIEIDGFESIDLSSLVEQLAPGEAKPVVTQPPVAPVAVSTPERPHVNPALERLETFLQAILRAGETAGRSHVA